MWNSPALDLSTSRPIDIDTYEILDESSIYESMARIASVLEGVP